MDPQGDGMMEQEETRVFVTIDDVIDDRRLSDLLEADLGHSPERETVLRLAREVSDYDEGLGGFVIKSVFRDGDDGSLDAWEEALEDAEEEESRLSISRPVLVVDGVCGLRGEPEWECKLFYDGDDRYVLADQEGSRILSHKEAADWARRISSDHTTGMMDARGHVSADADRLLQDVFGGR